MSDVRHRRDRDAVLERDVFELLRNRVSRCDVLLNRADADATCFDQSWIRAGAT